MISNLSLHSKVRLRQLCPTLCDPIDGSLPGSSVHGILQVRVMEWVAIAFSIYHPNYHLIEKPVITF